MPPSAGRPPPAEEEARQRRTTRARRPAGNSKAEHEHRAASPRTSGRPTAAPMMGLGGSLEPTAAAPLHAQDVQADAMPGRKPPPPQTGVAAPDPARRRSTAPSPNATGAPPQRCPQHHRRWARRHRGPRRRQRRQGRSPSEVLWATRVSPRCRLGGQHGSGGERRGRGRAAEERGRRPDWWRLGLGSGGLGHLDIIIISLQDESKVVP